MTLLAGFELSLLFVCIWGFIAVLLTGQFSTVVITGCILALIIGYRLRRNGWRPGSLTANIAAVVVFIIVGSIYVGTFNLLIATVYLFLFLQVTKFLTRQNLVESRWCYLISLFNVIGASVITTAITFGLMLMVYVFLALISLRLYVMAREWESNLPPGMNAKDFTNGTALTSEAGDGPFKIQVKRLPRRMLLTSGVLTILIMLLAAGIFSAIPRLATQNLFHAYGPPQEEPAVSAFSENVEFGAFTEIQLDDAVALFVQPQAERRPSHVRMRGVALDTFDGKTWSRTGPSMSPRSNQYEYRPIFTTHRYETQHKHRVIQPPGVTNFLFGDSFPIEIKVPHAFSFNVDRMAQTVSLSEMPPKDFQYEVVSMHEALSLRQDPSTISELYRPASHLTLSRDSFYYDGFRLGQRDARSTGSMVDSSELPEIDTTIEPETWELSFGNFDSTTTDEPEYGRHREDFDRYPVAAHAGEASGWDQSASEVSDDEDGRSWSNGEPEDVDQLRRRGPWLNDDVGESTTDTRDRAIDGLWRFSRANFRRTPEQVLQQYLAWCLALPDSLNVGKVPELADEWTGDLETTFAKAMEIERRLRNDYGYSLKPQARGNYIESFLFDVQEGHCEYFATSMAVLLRNIGIPARVVNGFYSTEWNSLSGMFTVRQRDAHSWVEAWMGDSYGWMTFDPTPPNGVARRGDRSALLDAVSRLSDAVRMRWYRYVVDYSFTDQVVAVREILRWRRSFMEALKQRNILGISSDDKRQVEIGGYTREVDWRPIGIAAGIILLLLLWQGARWIGRRHAQRYSSIAFYDKLLRHLARHGYNMKPGQTPREFAKQLATERESLKEIPAITELYYKTKFDDKDPGPELNSMIAHVRQELRRRPSR